MLSRKDAYGLLLTPLIGLLGLGCAEIPFQPPTQAARHQIDSSQPSRIRADAQLVPALRIAAAPLQKPPLAGADPQETAQAGAPAQPAPPAALPDSAGEPPPLVNTAGDPSSAVNNLAAKLRTLHREAAEHYGAIDSYIVRLIRREQINGKDNPEEILLVKFRKEPWSIYFKWLGAEGRGREVVYVRDRYDNKIHSLLASGDVPLMPAGKRFAVSPDSPLVLSSSRHSIHEAGMGVLIEKFGRVLDAADRSGHRLAMLKYLGPMNRPEFEVACDVVEQTIAAGAEPQLPRGGRRLWAFDPVTKFPVLLITQDETGHEVEYYCYDRFQFPVRLDDDDFNPDKLWNQKR